MIHTYITVMTIGDDKDDDSDSIPIEFKLETSPQAHKMTTRNSGK